MSDSIFLNIAVPTPTSSSTVDNNGNKKRTQAKERFKEKIKANKKGIQLNPKKFNKSHANRANNKEVFNDGDHPNTANSSSYNNRYKQSGSNSLHPHSKKIYKQNSNGDASNRGYAGKEDYRMNKSKEFKKRKAEPVQLPAPPEKEFAEVLQIDENKGQEGDVFSAERFDQIPELHPFLVSSLNKNNYITMTQIQKSGIPILLKGKDSIVKSETGSGKTLTYLVPILNSLAKSQEKVQRGDGTYSFILCPTRELCIQVLTTANALLNAFVHVVAGSLMVHYS